MSSAERGKRNTLIALPPLKPDDGRTVQRQVYDHLRWLLLSGHLEPGYGISLRNTADALGISATPVREALRRLENEGGLVTGANRVISVPMMSAEDLLDICDVRLALEGMATRLAAVQMKKEELAALIKACSAMGHSAAKQDVDLYLERNWIFHSNIYRAAHNRPLTDLIEGIWLRVGPLIRLAIPSPEHFSHSMDCHWAVLEALQHGDAEDAGNAIEKDISYSADDLVRILRARG
jgi:DNA-binding GntR family transcriptional regulator